MRIPGAALAAVAAMAALLVAVPAVGARAAGQSTAVTLRLASQTAWVRPGETFDLRIEVAGVSNPDRVEVAVSVYGRVTSRSQFRLTTQGRSLGSTILRTSAPLSRLGDAAGAFLVRLGPPELDLTRTGVYPVAVTVRQRTGKVLARMVTHLVFVADSDAPRLRVAWLAVLHTPAHRLGRPGSTRGLSQLADTLAAPVFAGVPFTLVPTPETLDALARSRREADRAALAALRRAAAGRQVLARPYVPVDAAALVRGGLGSLLVAEAHTGAAVIAQTLGTQPDTGTWLADGGIDPLSAQRLRDARVERFVVPEAALAPVPLQVTLAAPFELEIARGTRVPAVMADEDLTAHFRNGGDQVLAAHHLLADLATIWMDAPQRRRGVVVLPPRSWVPARPFLDAAFSGLVASPVVEVVPLDELFAGIPAATTTKGARLVRHLAPVHGAGPQPTALASAAQKVEALQAALPPGSPTRERLVRRLLAAASADLTSRGARARIDAVEGLVDAVASRIVAPPRRTVTLTAREGEIPLTFENRGPEPLTVAIHLQSDRLRFPDGAAFTLELPPRNHTVRVAVEARTAGLSPLDVAVLAPGSDLQLAAARLEVRSTAASGVGIALSGGAGLFLAAWWARHLVRGRRARHLVPAP